MNPILNYAQWLNEAAEAQASQQDIQTAKRIETSLSSCFDAKKYPNLAQVAGGSVKTVLGLLLIYVSAAGEVFSFGFGTVPSVILGATGAAKSATGLIEIYHANLSKIEGELGQLMSCVMK